MSNTTEAEIDAADTAYCDVWNNWKNIDAENVREVRRAALSAAFTAAAQVREEAVNNIRLAVADDARRLYEDGAGSSDDLGKCFPSALDERPNSSDPARAP